MEGTSSFIIEYIQFVETELKKFKSIGDLTRLGEVPLDKVFKALADYYNVCISLNAEYQRYKIKKVDLELEYESKYSDWFLEAKTELYSLNGERKTKPALKEIEQLIIETHKEEYFLWKRKLATADAECDFFIRLRETLNKYDGILISLASSMRMELRSLNIENRAEGAANPAQVQAGATRPVRKAVNN